MRKILTFILILCTVALFAEMRGGALYDPGANRADGTGPEAQFMKFDPDAEMPAYAEGRLFWDKDNGCPAFYPDMAGPIMQVGQEFWVRVKNAGVATMTNGSVVCLNEPGAGIDPVAVLADASSVNTSKFIGVVTADISPDSSGYATVFGLVRGLNTASFTPGARIFLAAGSPGTFTETAPTAPNYSVVVGYVMKAHATTGSIYVRPWINGALDRAQFASTLAAATGTAILPTYSFASDPNTGMYSFAADTLAFAVGGAESFRVNSAGEMLIATSTDASDYKLQVNGNAYVNGDMFQNLVAAGITSGHFRTVIGSIAVNATQTIMPFGSAMAGDLRVYSGSTPDIGNIRITGTTLALESGSSSNFSVTKDNAGTINIYVESGFLVVQNKEAAARSFYSVYSGIRNL